MLVDVSLLDDVHTSIVRGLTTTTLTLVFLLSDREL